MSCFILKLVLGLDMIDTRFGTCRIQFGQNWMRERVVFEICTLYRILLLECAAEFCISAEKCLCMAGCEKGSTYGVLDIF